MVSDVLSPVVVVHLVLLLDKVYVCLHICTVCHQHTSCCKSALLQVSCFIGEIKVQDTSHGECTVLSGHKKDIHLLRCLQQWGLLHSLTSQW